MACDSRKKARWGSSAKMQIPTPCKSSRCYCSLIFTHLVSDIQGTELLKDALSLKGIKTLKFEDIFVQLLDFIWPWLIELLVILQTEVTYRGLVNNYEVWSILI